MHDFSAGLIRKARMAAGGWFVPRLVLIILTFGLGLSGAFAVTNDNFANATPVGLGFTTITAVVSTTFTKEVGEPPASAGTGGASAWWSWNSGSFSGPVICSTAGSNFDTVLDVWTGSTVSTLTRVTFNDDYSYGLPLFGGFNRTSMAPFTAATNTTYYFRVDGYSPPQTGTGNIFFALQINPTVTMSATTPAQEGSTPGSWTISLSSSLVDEIPLYWGITGGTAASSRYSIPQAQPLLIPGGTTSTQITLNVPDDGIVTGNTTVINSLQPAPYGNYLLGNPATSTLTIVDMESPQVFVNQSASGLNNGTSWANAFTDLHQALSNAVAGNQIWVAQGTYVTSSQSDTFHLVAGTSIYGGFVGNESALSQRNRFQHLTTLSGVYATGLNSLHVATGANNCTIEGFTITGGNASASNGSIDSFGGGMVINDVSQSIRGCVFTGNQAFDGGGAIYMFPLAIVPIVDSCYFVGNSCTSPATPYGGGAIIFGNGSPATFTLSNCVFANNTTSSANGGALFAFTFNNGIILNCTFFGNTNSTATGAGAIYDENTTGMSIVNSIFSGNTNTSGAASLLFAAGSTQSASTASFKRPFPPA